MTDKEQIKKEAIEELKAKTDKNNKIPLNWAMNRFSDALGKAEKEKQEQVEKLKNKIKKRRDFYTNLLKERGHKKGTIKALRITIIIEDHNRILEYIDKIFGTSDNPAYMNQGDENE